MTLPLLRRAQLRTSNSSPRTSSLSCFHPHNSSHLSLICNNERKQNFLPCLSNLSSYSFSLAFPSMFQCRDAGKGILLFSIQAAPASSTSFHLIPFTKSLSLLNSCPPQISLSHFSTTSGSVQCSEPWPAWRKCFSGLCYSISTLEQEIFPCPLCLLQS